ncbi:hypothetical protein PtA15_2A376 [Puccinia triticina]|uniref:Uncharacterized protein n=1 Tax=Puccinia triticina TaxID=208348 RepID=A0ABY7CCH1_9BASI|nr:uncharacterized protein PtA15_2A376 [Puccinia triticina]WAQ82063.1 hypothetical protein PtA15_2A376 [Puccinia triticina]
MLLDERGALVGGVAAVGVVVPGAGLDLLAEPGSMDEHLVVDAGAQDSNDEANHKERKVTIRASLSSANGINASSSSDETFKGWLGSNSLCTRVPEHELGGAGRPAFSPGVTSPPASARSSIIFLAGFSPTCSLAVPHPARQLAPTVFH